MHTSICKEKNGKNDIWLRLNQAESLGKDKYWVKLLHKVCKTAKLEI